MRGDRLISIISLLQLNKKIKAKDLAEKLEVSVRTIYRDIDTLSSMGVPVIADQGHDGGITLLGDYKTDLTGLTDKELQYLFLPQPQKLLKDLNIENLSHNSLLKLLGSTSKQQLELIENMQNYLYIDMYSWNEINTTDRTILTQLQKSIWASSEVTISYSKATGEKQVNINPLGLVNKKGVWYLIAVDHVIKTYRVSSIKSVNINNKPFKRPDDFNLVEYWNASTSKFMKKIPKYRLSIKTNSDTFSHIKKRKFINIIEESCEDDSFSVVLEFNAKWQAVEFAMGYGDNVKIIEPEEVKCEIVEKAENILKMYL